MYPDAKDRQFLYYFHKGAKKERFNVQKYNELREELASVCCYTYLYKALQNFCSLLIGLSTDVFSL